MIKMIRLLLGWMPELKKNLLYGIFFKCIEAVFMGAPYGFLFLLLSDLHAGELTLRKVMLYTLGVAGCLVLQVTASYYFAKIVWPLANQMVKGIRIKIGEHLRKLSMGYFSQNRTGSLNTLAVDEMQFVQIVMYQAFPDFIFALTFGIAGPVVLLLCDLRMGLAAVAAIPIALLFFWRYNKVSAQALATRSMSLAELNAHVIEYIQGMEVARVFGRSKLQFNRTSGIIDAFRKINISCELKAGLPICLSKLSLDMGIMAMLAAGLAFWGRAALEPDLFLLFIVLSLRIYEPVRLLIPAYGFCNLARPALERIEELLQTPPLPQPVKPKLPQRFDIKISDITFAYEETQILREVSLDIPEKRITAIIGPSGSGKTTLTSLIARFWDVDSGSISIGGVDIRDMRSDDLHGLISMVFQDVYLFNDTIRANIAIGAGSGEPIEEEIMAAAKKAGCHDYILGLAGGYDTIVGEGGAALSGGERQRISIARAMLKDAPIIILDEATASVDPENENLIQESIDRLVQSKTLVVIAHRLTTIAGADHIVVLDRKGRVAQAGRHEALLASHGPYRQLWQSRIHAGKWRISA